MRNITERRKLRVGNGKRIPTGSGETGVKNWFHNMQLVRSCEPE
jgi:hypothetical protein